MTDSRHNYSALIHEHGVQGAADLLGISYDAVRFRRNRQVRRAERGEWGLKPVMPGFGIKSVSSKTADGEWVKQTKAAGEVYEVPDYLTVKGESAYTDADGRLIAKWTLSREGAQSAALCADMVRAAFNNFVSRYEPIVAPEDCNEALLTQYVVGDHHLGLLAWGAEAGEDYDLKIGERLLRDKMTELVARTPNSHTGMFLNLGDFFHSDSSRSETTKGTRVDMDSRYGKVGYIGMHLATACIEMLLRKHERVVVWWLAGNHDENVAIALMLGLKSWFKDESRVEIDFNPSKFRSMAHGRTMLVATHGDQLKPKDIAEFSAAKWPEMWGATRHRYAAFGHVHHSAKGGEPRGMVWESFQTLAAKDAWHSGEGYQSGRSMTAITYHQAAGEFSRNRVSVG